MQNTTAVVRSMAQTLQAIPPGGSCDEAATSEITRCIATLRAGSLRWAQHRMAAMEIRDEKDMETHQHISVERILEHPRPCRKQRSVFAVQPRGAVRGLHVWPLGQAKPVEASQSNTQA